MPVVSQSNFGPADNTTMVTAWGSPTAASGLVLPVSGCIVVEAHVRIQCTVGTSLGSVVTWRVVVEGQSNTLPVSSTALPVVHSVSFGAGVMVADTLGGTPLIVTGANFGPLEQYIQVSFSVPVGTVTATGCSLTTPDTVLECQLPPGSGVLQQVTVTVLGQSVRFDAQDLAYAAPVVTSVVPAVWPTDVSSLSVVVQGSGFGVPAQASAVFVTLNGTFGCSGSLEAGSQGVTVVVTSITVRSDRELVFVVPSVALQHAVSLWTITVSVSGQVTTVSVPTLGPTLPSGSLTFDSAPNATHYFLTITGTNFGPGVSGCVGDVAMMIDGQPCAQLIMTKVGCILVVLCI